MAQQNLTIVLPERPTAGIVLGKTFNAEYQPMPTAENLKDDEILVEHFYLSLDPTMR
ncbi:hypothetical protein RAB80_012822, partial [Fusarium oxysporum f. sp. vasinfectum]